jgi:hypothetical protein
MDDAIFANKLGHFYQGLAQQLGDFVHKNIGSLSDTQIDALSNDQTTLIAYANTFFALSDKIAFEQSETYFKGVSDSIDTINAAMKKMNDINKVTGIIAGVITLAAAIVTQNGSGIVSSLQTIAGAVSAKA